MTAKKFKNKRKGNRYDTDLEIQFFASFDMRTRIDYQLKRAVKQAVGLNKPASGISKNISVEGLRFCTEQPLQKGDTLLLDLFVPSAQTPVPMEGQVRWTRPDSLSSQDGPQRYEVGVKLLSVRGEEVEKTVFFDEIHKIMWSNVLEAVFVGFEDALKQRRPLGDELQD